MKDYINSYDRMLFSNRCDHCKKTKAERMAQYFTLIVIGMALFALLY